MRVHCVIVGVYLCLPAGPLSPLSPGEPGYPGSPLGPARPPVPPPITWLVGQSINNIIYTM